MKYFRPQVTKANQGRPNYRGTTVINNKYILLDIEYTLNKVRSEYIKISNSSLMFLSKCSDLLLAWIIWTSNTDNFTQLLLQRATVSSVYLSIYKCYTKCLQKILINTCRRSLTIVLSSINVSLLFLITV